MLDLVALGEGRAGLVAERPQHAVVAVIGGEDHATQGDGRPAAAAVPVVDVVLGAEGLEGFADQRQIAPDGSRNVGQDQPIVGAGHAERGVGRDHDPGDLVEGAELGG